MKKLAEKWYISIFVIPILMTYFTSFIQLPEILSNWEYSIILSLSILVFILIHEIRIRNKKILLYETKPTEKDKMIIYSLLETLNLKMFQEDVCRQDAWNGYPREAIHNIIEFQHDAVLIKNHTSINELNCLINDFLTELREFTEYSSMRLYGSNEWLIPFKDNPRIYPLEQIKNETNIMNTLSKKAFDKLELLMIYLRTHDCLINV